MCGRRSMKNLSISGTFSRTDDILEKHPAKMSNAFRSEWYETLNFIIGWQSCFI